MSIGRGRDVVLWLGGLAIAFAGDTAPAAAQILTEALRPTSADISTPPFFGGVWVRPEREQIPPGLTVAELFPPEPPEPAYVPEYRKKHDKIQAIQEGAGSGVPVGADAIDTVAFQRQISCLPYGMPRMMKWQFSLDVLQAPDRITMIGEIEREVRRIWLNREMPPLDELDITWFGYSVGRWDGDALVVTTAGIDEDVDGENYMAHSEHMVIEERIYLHKPDVLYIDITITDPIALTAPLSYRAVWVRAPKDFQPPEFVCDNLRAKYTEDGQILFDTRD